MYYNARDVFPPGQTLDKECYSTIPVSALPLNEGLDPSLQRAVKLRMSLIDIMGTGERCLAGSARGQLILFCAVLKIEHINMLFALEICLKKKPMVQPYINDASNWLDWL
jgi:hypothetical protein